MLIKTKVSSFLKMCVFFKFTNLMSSLKHQPSMSPVTLNPSTGPTGTLLLCRQPPPNMRRSMVWIGSYSLQKASVRYMGIVYVITHPDFKVSRDGYVNDLALVRLKKKITFSREVAPVRLPGSGDTFGTSSNCWIIGWGNIETNGTPPAFGPDGASWPSPLRRLVFCAVPLPDPETLQQLQLPIIPQSVCKEKYPELTDSMLCAGDLSGGKGPCKVSV